MVYANQRRPAASLSFSVAMAGVIIATALFLVAVTAPAISATVCPDIGTPPIGAKRFALNAATISAPTQSLAYNGSLVGPLIKVRLGDVVQVDVTNTDITAGTSVHWHGQDLRNASWADGPAGVNQYPIPVGDTFSYRFTAQPAGTYWYHSHTSAQFGDGLRGPLIVEDPNDPQKSLYDQDLDEHVLMVADVFSTTVEAQVAKLQKVGMANMKPLCDPAVLNMDISDAPWMAAQVNGQGYVFVNGSVASGKPLVVNVKAGQRYRLRWIGGMSSWAMQIAVRNHSYDVIAFDARPIEPIKAQSYILSAGERMDAVLTANQPVGNYWIDISTINGFNSPAILHYEGAADPATDPTLNASLIQDFGCAYGVGGRPGMIDPKNATFKAFAGTPAPPAKADRQVSIYLPDASASAPPAGFLTTSGDPYGISKFTPQNGSCPGGSKYCWSMNWVVFEENAVAPNLFYGTSTPTSRSFNLDLALNEVVDLTFVNPSAMVHPMHLHGNSFRVLATGNGFPLDPATGKLASTVALDVSSPPVRDTIPVPQAVYTNGTILTSGYGYAVLRFRADNPGPWSFHCHIDLHAASGMFMTLTVKPPNATEPWIVPKNQACGAATATSSAVTASATASVTATATATAGVSTTTSKPSSGEGKAIGVWTAAAAAILGTLALLL